jgi:hypothetical protein
MNLSVWAERNGVARVQAVLAARGRELVVVDAARSMTIWFGI